MVLAGYMRIVGPAVLEAFAGRILNTHPSLLPAFPGAHAVADALAHGATVTGCTVHLVDETLDGGPIVAQDAVPILADDDVATPPRSDPRRRAPAAAAGRRSPAGRCAVVEPGGRRVRIDIELADAEVPVPRRALLSVSDKTGLASFAAASRAAAVSSSSRLGARPVRCAMPACR